MAFLLAKKAFHKETRCEASWCRCASQVRHRFRQPVLGACFQINKAKKKKHGGVSDLSAAPTA
jgi:hypothetical protein